MKEDITFIAKRYRTGKFSIDKGWKRMNIKTGVGLRRFRVAAAIAAVVVLSSTAAIIYHQFALKSQQSTQTEQIQPAGESRAVKVIDFECTPLPSVVERIKEVYGVEVGDLPENAGDYHLSLHYEGSAAELVATINEILETQMTVKE